MENYLLKHRDWNTDVKNGINELLIKFGNKSDNYKKTYAVFDFDNTTTIFDSCENTLIYQFEHMIFAFTPNNIRKVLSSDLSGFDKDLTYLGFGNGSYNDWLDDIENAYTHLYNNYGPFGVNGVNDDIMNKIREDDYWLEFAVKLRVFYDLIGANESTDVSYPWVIYIFDGFTPEEIYNCAFRACEYYKNRDTDYIDLTSPENIKSKVGVVNFKSEVGISVTDNIKELWRCLNNNGIDVWVCSASEINLVRGAIDSFGLHNDITGLMGMTSKIKNGKCISEYDYENSHSYIKNNDGWIIDSEIIGAQTQGKGKVTAINNVCVKKYGCGPVCCFGDSTGDFQFCTEYNDTKLVCCFNRANRKVSDGGSLLAELAFYQKYILKSDFNKTNDDNDTLFLLQGRDENKKRSFRSSEKSIRYNTKSEKLFAEDKSRMLIQYFGLNNMSIKTICETFSIINNIPGFLNGFLTDYNGYHNIK